MDMREKLAVLKLAGYEIKKALRPDHVPQWDWSLFVDGEWVETSDIFHRAKFEAVNDAFAYMLLNTPKENNVCPK